VFASTQKLFSNCGGQTPSAVAQIVVRKKKRVGRWKKQTVHLLAIISSVTPAAVSTAYGY
jgi:hypothetical protein